MVCAWQNSAVPCEEAHNLYYMNRNFFVVTNDVKKETTTLKNPVSGYPAPQPVNAAAPSAGSSGYLQGSQSATSISSAPQSNTNTYPGGPIITSGPDAISTGNSAVSTGTQAPVAPTTVSPSSPGNAVQPGSVYPSPNQRG